MRGFFVVFFPHSAQKLLCAMLDLKDVLDALDTGRWVSLAFVKADRTRGAGGEIVRLPRCRQKVHTAGSAGSPSGANTPAGGAKKAPNHKEHGTRNLILPNGGMCKVHYRAIFQFQGKPVL